MQRLFSTFANGWPGIGLFVQRLLIGTALLYYGIDQVEQTNNIAIFLPSFIEAIAGIFLVVGLWTPVVGTLAALTEVWNICCHSGDFWIAIILATLSTSLAMIGPGAWSIDACLFGRKHMDIPKR
jgi:putative oxidoreductase